MIVLAETLATDVRVLAAITRGLDQHAVKIEGLTDHLSSMLHAVMVPVVRVLAGERYLLALRDHPIVVEIWNWDAKRLAEEDQAS